MGFTLPSSHWILKLVTDVECLQVRARAHHSLLSTPGCPRTSIWFCDPRTKSPLRAISTWSMLLFFQLTFTEVRFGIKFILLWKPVLGTLNRSQDKRNLFPATVYVYFRGTVNLLTQSLPLAARKRSDVQPISAAARELQAQCSLQWHILSKKKNWNKLQA